MVVEDDTALRTTIVATLRSHDYATVEASNGAAAMDVAHAVDLDLVLLDLGLPDVGGLHLCRFLRATLACPIVVVSGDDRSQSTVALLDGGADDYVVKPYDPDVLLARVRVALRHRATTVGQLDDTVVPQPDRILTYDTLVKAIWGFDPPGDADKALRTIVSRLRRTLGNHPQRPRIETERHVGYRFVTPRLGPAGR